MNFRFMRFERATEGRLRRKWLVGFVALCVALPLLMFAGVAWYDRAVEMRDARQKALATSYMLAEHVDSVFRAIDVALLQVDLAIANRPLAELRTDGEVHKTLLEVQRRLPSLESVFLVDEAGSLAASSRAFPMPPYEVQNREYFLAGKAGHDGLFFSQPFRGQFSRSVSFTASRRVIRDDVFRGVAAVTIFPEYFHSLYRGAFPPDSNAVAALMRKDGSLIFRSPSPRNASERMQAPPELVARAAAQSSGLISGAGGLDGKSGITAFRTLPNSPLTLIYAVGEAEALTPWYGRLASYGIAAAGVSGILAAAGALVLRGLLRWQPSGADTVPRTRGREPVDVIAGEPASRVERGADTLLGVVLTLLALVRQQLPQAAPAGERNESFNVDLKEAVEGAAHGVSTVQRLLAGVRARGSEARIVNVSTSLIAAHKLLMGSIWPPLELPDMQEQSIDVFVDPARFDLALVDLVLGLKEVAPAGARLTVEASRRMVRNVEVEGLTPGDYVAIAFALDSPEGTAREASVRGETRLRLVARFAAQSDGGLVFDEGAGAPVQATLWLPAALIRRESRKA